MNSNKSGSRNAIKSGVSCLLDRKEAIGEEEISKAVGLKEHILNAVYVMIK
jgi:hypothetical protein